MILKMLPSSEKCAMGLWWFLSSLESFPSHLKTAKHSKRSLHLFYFLGFVLFLLYRRYYTMYYTGYYTGQNRKINGKSPILNPLLYSMTGSKFRKTAKVRNLIPIVSWITSSDWTKSKSLFRKVFKKVKIRPNHLHAINYRRF